MSINNTQVIRWSRTVEEVNRALLFALSDLLWRVETCLDLNLLSSNLRVLLFN